MTVRSRIAERPGAAAVPAVKAFGGSVPQSFQQGEQASQMTPATPFSPGQPVQPYDGYDRHPRVHDFPAGVNISTRPRTHERVSFETLRGLIDAYDVASICIWHKIDTLRGVKWKLLPADGYRGDVSGAIDIAKTVMRRPDGIHNFKTWFGKWFYDVLAYDAAPLYRLRNRGGKVVGLMPFDGTCYSGDTEVLTRAGWKRFADVDISGDEFATRNQKTKAFEWQSATHYTVQDWAGREPLYRFHSRSYDLLVTGNHRMLVSSLPRTLGGCGHPRESFVPAEVLAEHFTSETTLPATSSWTGTPITRFRLPMVKRGECVTMSGVREARKARGWSQAVAETAAGLTHQTYWSAENGHQVELSTAEAIRHVLGDVTWEVTGSLVKVDAINGDDFAAFMGMWLSEGSLTIGRNFVHVSQREKSKGYQEFRHLLIRILGTEPSYSGNGWRFKSAALVQYLRQFGHAPDKFIPAEILDASAEQLAIFWRFYMLGDGCYEPGGRQRIITASRRMADGLQEVAQKTGFQASVIERQPGSGHLPGGRTQISPVRPSYAVTLRTTKNYRVRHVDRVPYDGKVYCVTVPNETLYVRRNGQPSWCGNTLAPLQDYWGNSPRAAAPGDPEPEAYVQYVHGLPWNWLTRSDVIYEPFRAVNSSMYGKAPIESIILNANTDLRFQLYFLQRFTDGNIPEAFASSPESWRPDQIELFQNYWDGFMYGDQARKHQIRWMPGGSTIAWSNEKDFSDGFSLFMMRKTCASFHTVPTDLGFTETSNYSSGESQADVAHKVGELPPMEYAEEILSRFIFDDLMLPVRFEFDRGEDQDDRLVQAQADDIYIKNGTVSGSLIRELRFGEPEPDGQVMPRYIFTERSGPVPLAALMGVAGKLDPESGAPQPGVPLPHEAFTEVQGVISNPPVVGYPLAEQEFGPKAIPPAPPPQPLALPAATDPAHQVAKEGEGSGAAPGITSETGLYGYDGPGHRDRDEDEDDDGPVDLAVLAKSELSAFRRFRQARRKAGKWRDFAFEAVDAGTARRLNAEGRDAVAKAVSGYTLTPRSGMISLDVPDGLISPLPGGVTDFHITVVYLGPDVGDDLLVQALAAARDAAAAVPGPLDGTLSGISSFPPSDSSDGKVPAFVPVMLPGAGVLRDALAGLSASEFTDWHPHVTVAYMEPGDALPGPLPPTPVTFTHLSVHRGDEVTRFPLGANAAACCGGDCCQDGCCNGSAGCPCGAADVAKAGGPPKAPARTWPGWALDPRAVAYWAPRVTDAVALSQARLNGLAAAYLAANPAPADGQTGDKRDRNAAAAAWLAAQGVTFPLGDLAAGIVTDGYLIGSVSATALVTGQDADTGGWQPGDSGKAAKRTGETSGGSAVLALLPGSAADSAGKMSGAYLAALGTALASGADGKLTAAALGAALAVVLADGALAAGLVADQITAASGTAAQACYTASDVDYGQWLTDPGASKTGPCPLCLANEAAGRVPVGDPYPSGDTQAPAHPGCNCQVVPG